MTTREVDQIRVWATPKNIKDVQSLIVFANFYRRLIMGFSKVANPLTDWTKKGIKWD